ncbi:MAG: hypothetical protein KKA42_02590, partial [candidate division Zixibacteria bacterium]|nr:hypothetical protein [candidate division Zixibacteria bacterium]
MDEDVIIDAMERVYCLIPHLPGVVEYLAIPGVSACVTPVSHYTTNVVSRARLDKTGADATIQRVCDYYQSRNLSFGWVIDPHTTPADLATRLYHGGLTQGTGM